VATISPLISFIISVCRGYISEQSEESPTSITTLSINFKTRGTPNSNSGPLSDLVSKQILARIEEFGFSSYNNTLLVIHTKWSF
jgi:hypothetical protein